MLTTLGLFTRKYDCHGEVSELDPGGKDSSPEVTNHYPEMTVYGSIFKTNGEVNDNCLKLLHEYIYNEDYNGMSERKCRKTKCNFNVPGLSHRNDHMKNHPPSSGTTNVPYSSPCQRSNLNFDVFLYHPFSLLRLQRRHHLIMSFPVCRYIIQGPRTMTLFQYHFTRRSLFRF